MRAKIYSSKGMGEGKDQSISQRSWIFDEIRHFLKGNHPDQFEDRVMIVSMYNDIEVDKTANEAMSQNIAAEIAQFAKRFKPGHWTFIGLGSGEKWDGSMADEWDGRWDSTAEVMMKQVAQSGHPVFRCSDMKTSQRKMVERARQYTEAITVKAFALPFTVISNKESGDTFRVSKISHKNPHRFFTIMV